MRAQIPCLFRGTMQAHDVPVNKWLVAAAICAGGALRWIASIEQSGSCLIGNTRVSAEPVDSLSIKEREQHSHPSDHSREADLMRPALLGSVDAPRPVFRLTGLQPLLREPAPAFGKSGQSGEVVQRRPVQAVVVKKLRSSLDRPGGVGTRLQTSDIPGLQDAGPDHPEVPAAAAGLLNQARHVGAAEAQDRKSVV